MMKRALAVASLVMKPEGYNDGSLPSLIPRDRSGDFTFTRGSNLAATRVDENGLIEKGRENLLLQSNQFDTTWTTNDTSVTGEQSGYDGSNDAWLLDISGGTTSQFVNQNLSSSGVQTFSVYAKANTKNWLYLWAFGTGFPSSFFDLQNGVVGTQSNANATIESVGNGWYRCSMFVNVSASAFRIYIATDDNNINQTSGSIYMQSAQQEKGLVATDYIPTTTTTAKAGVLENTPRLDYSGGATEPSLLLEPSRTNLLPYSEYLGSSSWSLAGSATRSLENVITPDGGNLAYKVQANNNTQGRLQTYITANGNNHIFSGFFKGTGVATRIRIGNNQGRSVYYDIDANGNFTFDSGNAINDNYGIEDYGNGWKRIYWETNTAAGVSNYFQIYADNTGGTGSVYAYGIMIEDASYPTSYIPTYGTSVTRSYDSLSKYNFTDSLTQTLFIECGNTGYTGGGGEILIEKTNPVATIFRIYIEIDNSGTDVSRIRFRTEYPIANYDFNLGNKDEYKKIALSIDGSSVKFFGNGSLLGTYVVTPTIMEQLNWRVQSSKFSTKQFLLFPTALTDSECIALTTI